MRTKFQLKQEVTWKSKHGFYKGTIVGLHDDFIWIKLHEGPIYLVKFEDIVG